MPCSRPTSPIIFAYHGYPWLIHRLTYRRTNHENLHVRGYKEEGTTTTPFDMTVLNDLDRFHLVADVAERVPKLGPITAYIRQYVRDRMVEHKEYIAKYGQDMPEIRNWTWKGKKRLDQESRAGNDKRHPIRPLPEQRFLLAQVCPVSHGARGRDADGAGSHGADRARRRPHVDPHRPEGRVI